MNILKNDYDKSTDTIIGKNVKIWIWFVYKTESVPDNWNNFPGLLLGFI